MKKLIKVRPMFNRLITTMDLYEDDQIANGLIDTRRTKGSLKEYQTVVAVGTTVKNIEVGDVVAINPSRYATMKHTPGTMKDGIIDDNMVLGYKFNTITLNGEEHLMLYDSDIDFVIEESEEVEAGPIVIQPDKPKITV